MKKYIIILAAACLFIQCADAKKDTETNTKKPINLLVLTENQRNNLSLAFTEVQQESLAKTQLLTARTEVTPQHTVSITSPYGGYVVKIALLPGAKVTKGQVVVVLEDPQYIQMQEEYLTTKVLLEQAEDDYNRQRELNSQQAASDKVLQQAKATRSTLLIKKNALEQKLQLLTINPSSVTSNNIQRAINIYAPTTGVVSKVNINTGQYVSPADAMLEIINTSQANLALKVYEKDLIGMSIGQSLEAFTNAQPDVKLKAKIISMGNQVQPDGTIDVYAQLTDTKGIHITENMYFNINLQLEQANTLAVPQAAVVDFEGKKYVFIETKKLNYTLTPVEVGIAQNGSVALLSPNLSNKKIVSQGAYQLLTALKNVSEEE
jgi:cobalt-zinc-cadmium efflux system membrane fusion protein